MLRDLPLNLIAEITSGTVLHSGTDVICTSVSTDTRTLKNGSLYVPLTGERFNGHDFAAQAEAAGAVAMLADENIDTGMAVVRVENTLTALAELAVWHRDQFSGPVVAVTGSDLVVTGHGLTVTWYHSVRDRVGQKCKVADRRPAGCCVE